MKLLFQNKNRIMNVWTYHLMIQKSDISQGKYAPKQEKIDFIAKILQKITDDNVSLNKLGDLEPYFTDTKYAKIFIKKGSMIKGSLHW